MIRRLIAAAALVLLGATAFATVGPADTADAQTVPFPGNPHWSRPFGGEAITRYAVDPSAKALHPFLGDAANSWNQNSPYNQLSVLALGTTCSGISRCVTVAEDNGRPCGYSQAWVSHIPDAGHNHFQNGLIAGNWQGCGLTLAAVKHGFCHEFGHTQGLDHPGNVPVHSEPCYGWTGAPTPTDYNVRNFLHSSWD